ncbi:MAG: homoserine dehydrogenase [Saprospiraceae bacterium]
MQIGLFGFGTVGQGFYQILSAQNGAAPGRVVKICIRNPAKPRSIAPEFFTTNPNDILADPQIRYIVEATDSLSEAYDWTRRALLAGKTVVSANKAMLSRFLPALLQAEREGGGRLLHEAAACGSIPIFRQLRQFYRHDEVCCLEGVFNGTTNYILNQMSDNASPLEDALARAQAAGYAESDPSSDLQGADPAAKLSLLTARAFGLLLPPDMILRLGISQILPEDIAFAATRGRRVRLLNRAERVGEGRAICAWTLPAMIGPSSPYYELPDAYNIVRVSSRHLGEMTFSGKGAGGAPTGYAVLSDVSDDTPAGMHPVLQAAVLDYGRVLNVYVRARQSVREDFFADPPQEERISSAGRQWVGAVSLGRLSEALPALVAEGGFAAVWPDASL